MSPFFQSENGSLYTLSSPLSLSMSYVPREKKSPHLSSFDSSVLLNSSSSFLGSWIESMVVLAMQLPVLPHLPYLMPYFFDYSPHHTISATSGVSPHFTPIPVGCLHVDPTMVRFKSETKSRFKNQNRGGTETNRNQNRTVKYWFGLGSTKNKTGTVGSVQFQTVFFSLKRYNIFP
ncbi:hypothetical protein Droror1_Dr00006917 [Drosera rotundifolia]